MPSDWNQLLPYLLGGGALATITAIGKGIQWVIAIPQRQSQSTVQSMKDLQIEKDNLHERELSFKDQQIEDRDRKIANQEKEIEELKVLAKPSRRTRD